jgi:hypothetical protein
MRWIQVWNNHVGGECVRKETASRQMREAQGAEHPRALTTAKTLGTRTLDAPMQIDNATPQCQLSKRRRRSVRRVLGLALIAVSSVMAQNATTAPSFAKSVAASSLTAPSLMDAPEPQPGVGGVADLPDDPGQRLAASAQNQAAPEQRRVAPIHTKYILPGMSAQPIGARDKVMIGLKDSYSVMNFGGMFAAAGYEQLRNGQPNYGTDRGAFGERLGAAAIRDTAQGVLTDAFYAPLLHEDPRYYVEGPQYGTFHRVLYALTRPLITRTDSGRKTINGALLLGYASSSLVSDAYYPQINRNVRDTAAAFGGSIGGSALGFVLSEFTYNLWHDLHIGAK